MVTVEIQDSKTGVTLLSFHTNLSRQVVMAAYTRWKDGLSDVLEFVGFLKQLYPTATIHDLQNVSVLRLAQ